MSTCKNAHGQCLCGEVSYTIKAEEPLRMAQCHCKDCQRASGVGHMALAFFNEDDVDFEGDPASYSVTADSGNTNTRLFCKTCGSRIGGKNTGRPGLIALTAGSIDDNAWFKPGAIVYAAMRPVWDNTSTEIPNFDKMPPAPPAA